jgi:hypothetical protein
MIGITTSISAEIETEFLETIIFIIAFIKRVHFISIHKHENCTNKCNIYEYIEVQFSIFCIGLKIVSYIQVTSYK